MPKILRIAKWKETFEKSDAKRLLHLPWISVPTSMDSNGFVLMTEDFGVSDAPAIYGAWIALCQYAAGCTVRGTLATSRGGPIPLSRVARKSGWSVDLFERLVEWASSERIGWIEVVSENGSPRINPVPDTDGIGENPYYGHNITEHNGRTDGRSAAREEETRPPVRPILFFERWEEIKSHAESLHKAIDPQLRKLKKIDKELALQFGALRVYYPELDVQWIRMMHCIRARADDKGSLQNPWAWLKSEIIRSCNECGPGYDLMIGAMDMHPPATPCKS